MFQLSVKGDGFLRGCTVIVNGKAEAKGFVGCPGLNSEAFTLQDAVGKGVLQVRLTLHLTVVSASFSGLCSRCSCWLDAIDCM